jgi:cell division protein ZapA
MPQVTVTISGKTYRMACGDGEEAHLESLAALYDGKIEEMRKAFGEIGDMRLHVMAALTLADDLGEAQRKLGELEREVGTLQAAAATGEERTAGLEARLAEALVKTAERVERVARTLNPAVAPTQ